MTKVKCVCKNCKREFEVYPSDIKQGKERFCSKKCQYTFQSKKMEQICLVCNKKFFVKPYIVKKGWGNLCSQECMGIYLRKRDTVKCDYCGKEIEILSSKSKRYKKHYCNANCRDAFKKSITTSRSNRTKKKPIVNNKVNHTCKECGKEFEVLLSNIKKGKGKYCSENCRHPKREIIVKEDHALIPLTQNKFAVIDLEDIPLAKKYIWWVQRKKDTYYACGRPINNKNERVKLHRIILGLKKDDGILVDHRDRNGLNCKRNNIRLCNNSQNMQNSIPLDGCSSKYKGASYRKDIKRYVSLICLNGKLMHLGCFKDEIEAAKAYDKKALELFGEFARTNFPRENYGIR